MFYTFYTFHKFSNLKEIALVLKKEAIFYSVLLNDIIDNIGLESETFEESF